MYMCGMTTTPNTSAAVSENEEERRPTLSACCSESAGILCKMSETAGATPPKDQDIFGNELGLSGERQLKCGGACGVYACGYGT